MNHKRRRPKSTRAGCLLCKPFKRQGSCPRHTNMQVGNLRKFQAGSEQLRCEGLPA